MSEEDVRRHVDEAEEPENGDETPCPVLALGHRAGFFHFVTPAGEKYSYEARHFTFNGILALFGGKTRWLVEAYPREDKDGNRVGWNTQAAAAGLMRRCFQIGLFDAETPERGPGVWPRPGGGIIVHSGDRVTEIPVEGRWRQHQAGLCLGGALYLASPPLPPLAAQPASAMDGRALLTALNLWNYAPLQACAGDLGIDLPARLMLGWIAGAMLGAVPRWRVHVLITGVRGCGKSALALLAAAALGPQGKETNNFTEAGLRRYLSSEARAAILDEAEGDSTGERIQAAIELIRHMSSGEGLRGVRAGDRGQVEHFSAASPVLMAAVNAPQLMPQDRSRIWEIELLAADPRNRARVEKAMAWLEEASPALRARMVAGWPRMQSSLAAYHAALTEAGCDSRQADQLGGLLAGAATMIADKPVSANAAREEVEELGPLINRFMAEDREESDAIDCLRTLLTRPIENWKGGTKSTVGRVLRDAMYQATGGEDALLVHGLRLVWFELGPRKVPALLVANRHEGLRAIFRDTRWKDGGWKRALARLEGAKVTDKGVRFAGILQRAVIVPEQYLPLRGSDDDDIDEIL